MWSGFMRHFSSADLGATRSPPDGHPPKLIHAFTDPDPSKDGITGVFAPRRHARNASPFRPPPLDPVILHGYNESTLPTARLLDNALAEEIRIMLPERLRIVEDWRLTYSLEQDGASLATLYQKSAAAQGRRIGFVLVIRDDIGGTFGAYLSEHPHPATGYFGNGECFLWRASLSATITSTAQVARRQIASSPERSTPGTHQSPTPTSPEHDGNVDPSHRPLVDPITADPFSFKAFPYSGVNDYYMNCETGFLSMGAGDGHYGLWLDDSLTRGRSGRSLTFGNEPLSDEGEKFGILGIELWVLGT